jgi:hypothetical protein
LTDKYKNATITKRRKTMRNYAEEYKKQYEATGKLLRDNKIALDQAREFARGIMSGSADLSARLLECDKAVIDYDTLYAQQQDNKIMQRDLINQRKYQESAKNILTALKLWDLSISELLYLTHHMDNTSERQNTLLQAEAKLGILNLDRLITYLVNEPERLNVVLLWASRNRDAEYVTRLLEAGADVHTCNDLALEIAIDRGDEDIVEILKKAASGEPINGRATTNYYVSMPGRRVPVDAVSDNHITINGVSFTLYDLSSGSSLRTRIDDVWVSLSHDLTHDVCDVYADVIRDDFDAPVESEDCLSFLDSGHTSSIVGCVRVGGIKLDISDNIHLATL